MSNSGRVPLAVSEIVLVWLGVHEATKRTPNNTIIGGTTHD